MVAFVHSGLRNSLGVCVVFLLLAALQPAAPAFAAGEALPGFLPDASGEAMTWDNAEQFCKSRGGLLPTARQLHDMDALKPKSGLEKTYWARDGQLGRQYAVTPAAGVEELHEKNTRHEVLCGYGAAAPEKALSPAPGFPTGLAPTTLFWQDAARYCALRGKQLPSVAALKAVSGSTGSFASFGWPAGLFWTREAQDAGHAVVNTGNGQTTWFSDTDRHWTTCTD